MSPESMSPESMPPEPRSCRIIESTLREGEQFANAFFGTEQKIEIAKRLDAFGVDCMELTSPAASDGSRRDCERIAGLGLRAKILTHIRCHPDDARLAVETGAQGIDIVFGTSSLLREFSHGRSVDQIVERAAEVIELLRGHDLEIRFSSEDSFRSDPEDLFRIYQTVDRLGVHRVGIADTVGVASPRAVSQLVGRLRELVGCDIEFHGHNDTGCAIANALCAFDAGATHIDTSVLGIGERNGITSLGGLVAGLYVRDPDGIRERYDLPLLRGIENFVAELVGIDVPFNNVVTGFCAFTHKAGIHAKAMLNNPSTYEILDPADFGLERYINVAHKLTGWNALRHRAEQLNLELDERELREITRQLKKLADDKPLGLSDVDTLLRSHRSQEMTLS